MVTFQWRFGDEGEDCPEIEETRKPDEFTAVLKPHVLLFPRIAPT